VFLVSSESQGLSLGIVFWFLAVMIERSGPKDKVGTQCQGIYPMSVLVQCSDEFALVRHREFFNQVSLAICLRARTYIFGAPYFDRSVAASSVN
jgi:hypothetical protein